VYDGGVLESCQFYELKGPSQNVNLRAKIEWISVPCSLSTVADLEGGVHPPPQKKFAKHMLYNVN
jgi:hypothetical protein